MELKNKKDVRLKIEMLLRNWKKVLREKEAAADQEVVGKEELTDSQEGQTTVVRQVDNRLQELHQIKISLEEIQIISRHRMNLSPPSQVFKQDYRKKLQRQLNSTKIHHKRINLRQILLVRLLWKD